jgi:hypothetical protein
MTVCLCNSIKGYKIDRSEHICFPFCKLKIFIRKIKINLYVSWAHIEVSDGLKFNLLHVQLFGAVTCSINVNVISYLFETPCLLCFISINSRCWFLSIKYQRIRRLRHWLKRMLAFSREHKQICSVIAISSLVFLLLLYRITWLWWWKYLGRCLGRFQQSAHSPFSHLSLITL